MKSRVNQNRIRIIKDADLNKGPVVYWMNRDQRIRDNWAFVHAQDIANELKAPLIVVYCLKKPDSIVSSNQLPFMLEGLFKLKKSLGKSNIPLHILKTDIRKFLLAYLKEIKASALVTDFSPLRRIREDIDFVLKKISIPFHEIDTHNIIPVWECSPKQEWAAYTIRSKINKQLSKYLDEFPRTIKHKYEDSTSSKILGKTQVYDPDTIENNPYKFKPGEMPAVNMLDSFITKRFDLYDSDRNDPTKDAQSGLSPYLHFGQISPQRVAMEIIKRTEPSDLQEKFLDELVVRRELSDNFCFYNSNYDSYEGLPDWGRQTLDDHRIDNREYIYSDEQFERAETHDPLWNAAQKEMITTGKMHGYMRMYWAKKILEWTAKPEDALRIGNWLNDRYELDGCDPNSYAGVAWSIGGLHDRAWTERGIFGKIRYMNYNGCKRKFNVTAYIDKYK